MILTGGLCLIMTDHVSLRFLMSAEVDDSPRGRDSAPIAKGGAEEWSIKGLRIIKEQRKDIKGVKSMEQRNSESNILRMLQSPLWRVALHCRGFDCT